MRHSVDDDAHGARAQWRTVCGIVGWAAFGITAIAALIVLWRLFGAGIALGLAGIAMPPSEANALRLTAAILAYGTGAIGVLAMLSRQWVLFVLALLLCAAAIVFLSGELTTR